MQKILWMFGLFLWSLCVLGVFAFMQNAANLQQSQNTVDIYLPEMQELLAIEKHFLQAERPAYFYGLDQEIQGSAQPQEAFGVLQNHMQRLKDLAQKQPQDSSLGAYLAEFENIFSEYMQSVKAVEQAFVHSKTPLKDFLPLGQAMDDKWLDVESGLQKILRQSVDGEKTVFIVSDVQHAYDILKKLRSDFREIAAQVHKAQAEHDEQGLRVAVQKLTSVTDVFEQHNALLLTSAFRMLGEEHVFNLRYYSTQVEKFAELFAEENTAIAKASALAKKGVTLTQTALVSAQKRVQSTAQTLVEQQVYLQKDMLILLVLLGLGGAMGVFYALRARP